MNPLKTAAPLFLILFSFAWGEISKQDIDRSIDKKTLKHPYLLFTESDKPAILENIKKDRESRDIMKQMMAEANRLLYQPVDYDIPVMAKNTRAGWTEEDREKEYDRYISSNRGNALLLAFLYQMTGEPKYAKKAFEFADAFCDLPTWTNRAHQFPIIYTRIMPYNVSDDMVCFNFDLNNGNAGRELGYVYDWLYPVLNQAQRDRIRGALLEKVITPVRGDYEYYWWASAYRCNWCGVCNSGVGVAALSLLTEDPQLTDVVAESYNRIYHMYDELGVDGGWQEGGGYWGYAMRTSVQFADVLKRMTRGKYNLFKHPKIQANSVTFPLYLFIPPNRSANFEDSGGFRIGPNYLFNKLASETGDSRAVWYRQNVLGQGGYLEDEFLDLIWPSPTQIAAAPEKTSIQFHTINYWVMRSDFLDPSKVIVTGKAGKNDDPHHGHLDIGQFMIYWNGQAYISDLGSIRYDQQYFNDKRWDYVATSSEGHNLIFVNGEQQIPGKMRKQPYNFDIGGSILEFRSKPEQDYVLMDPTNAYSKKELKHWRRHILLEKPEITIVLDEVQCNPGAEIEARFHSDAVIDTREKFILLKRNSSSNQRRRSYFAALEQYTPKPGLDLMAVIPILDTDYEVKEDRHAVLPVNAEAEFEWIPYFGVVVKAPAQKNLLAEVILPVKDAAEAEAIQASATLIQDEQGNVQLTFTRGGQQYTYLYHAQKDGLILE